MTNYTKKLVDLEEAIAKARSRALALPEEQRRAKARLADAERALEDYYVENEQAIDGTAGSNAERKLIAEKVAAQDAIADTEAVEAKVRAAARVVDRKRSDAERFTAEHSAELLAEQVEPALAWRENARQALEAVDAAYREHAAIRGRCSRILHATPGHSADEVPEGSLEPAANAARRALSDLRLPLPAGLGENLEAAA